MANAHAAVGIHGSVLPSGVWRPAGLVTIRQCLPAARGISAIPEPAPQSDAIPTRATASAARYAEPATLELTLACSLAEFWPSPRVTVCRGGNLSIAWIARIYPASAPARPGSRGSRGPIPPEPSLEPPGQWRSTVVRTMRSS